MGDHIEKINDNLVNGKRHFEVAKILQDTRIGSVLKFRLVEPLVYDFRKKLQNVSQLKVENDLFILMKLCFSI